MLAMVSLSQLGMIPEGYLILLGCVLALICLIAGGLLFFKIEQSGPAARFFRSFFALVLIAATVAGCFVVIRAARDVDKTVDKITQQEPSASTAAVYVLSSDPARSLEDATGYTFGFWEYGSTDENDQVRQKLGNIREKTYPSLTELVDALYAGQVQAVVLDPVYGQLLEEYEGYGDFLDRVRVLHEVEVMLQQPTEPAQGATRPNAEPEQTKPVEPMDVTEDPFVVYISGSDTRSSKLGSRTRSDVNILAVVNPKTKQVLLVNTPRDYYVANPAGNGAKDKLTHCGIYGVENSMKALSDLYGAGVDYYARINFTGFETLIDAIGGITVHSDHAFTVRGVTIRRGQNSLNGEEALVFARERHAVPGGDNTRGKNQMKVIQAVIAKATSGTTVITRYSEILNSLQGMFVTSLSSDEISRLVKMQLSDMASWDVYTYAVTGTGGSDKNYSMPGQTAYVCYPNMTTVEHAAALMERMLAGQPISENDI